MHGAGAAGGDPAAEFGAGQPQLVPNHPQQRRVGLDVQIVDRPVHLECDGHAVPPRALDLLSHSRRKVRSCRARLVCELCNSGQWPPSKLHGSAISPHSLVTPYLVESGSSITPVRVHVEGIDARTHASEHPQPGRRRGRRGGRDPVRRLRAVRSADSALPEYRAAAAHDLHGLARRHAARSRDPDPRARRRGAAGHRRHAADAELRQCRQRLYRR